MWNNCFVHVIALKTKKMGYSSQKLYGEMENLFFLSEWKKITCVSCFFALFILFFLLFFFVFFLYKRFIVMTQIKHFTAVLHLLLLLLRRTKQEMKRIRMKWEEKRVFQSDLFWQALAVDAWLINNNFLRIHLTFCFSAVY